MVTISPKGLNKVTNGPWASFIVSKTISEISSRKTKKSSSAIGHQQGFKLLKLTRLWPNSHGLHRIGEKILTVFRSSCLLQQSKLKLREVEWLTKGHKYERLLTSADIFLHHCHFPEVLLQHGGNVLNILHKLSLNFHQIMNYL